MKTFISGFVMALCVFCICSNSQAVESDGAGQRTKDLLDREPQIAAYIPGLKKEQDASGKEFYSYNGQDIGKMSKDDADKLYGRAQNEYVRLRTERLTRDLQRTRQFRQIPAPKIPQTPRTFRPPQIPKLPRTQTRVER